jgi:hypothetical protein
MPNQAESRALVVDFQRRSRFYPINLGEARALLAAKLE